MTLASTLYPAMILHMVDTATVRALATAVPGAEDTSSEAVLTFSIGGKGFAWTYLARPHGKPKAKRLPHMDVLAIRCPMERKELLIEAAPDRFFDDDHYRGYPAVLTRLEVVEANELAGLLRDAAEIVAAGRPKRTRKG